MIFIVITSQTGAKMDKMDQLTALRLGKVNAETITGETSETTNFPIPIVLWNQFNKAEGVFYLRVENDGNEAIRQKIDYLYSPNQSMAGRFRSLFDVYPLKNEAHGVKENKDVRALNFIDDIYTKDVNGDGIDELIVTRSLGGVEVYGREKKVFSYTPDVRPQLFEYKAGKAFHAVIDQHDEMLLVGYRTPYEPVDFFSESDKRFCHNTPDYRVIRVYPEGIREITPRFPDNKRPKTIDVAACLSGSESKDMDELILITTFEGMDGYYLSRHDTSGKALDTPRKIYAEGFDPNYYRFHFVPRSNQMIAHSHDQEKLYFITPEKPVNWFKSVKLDKLQADRLTGLKSSTVIVGQGRINGLPAVMIDNKNTLYVIDANGNYHASLHGENKSEKPVAYTTIKPLSGQHEIMTIMTLDQTLDHLLVIQSRKPGRREVSLEEMEWAGERFLSDSEWRHCKDELIPQYQDYMNDSIKYYCEQNKVKIPEIRSLIDIKNKLPGYYEDLVKDTEWNYQNSLKRGLFRPLDYENYSIDQSQFKKKEEYKKWLVNTFIAPELVVSIHDLSEGIVTTQKLADYYFTYLDDHGMASTQDHINIRATGDHGQAFLVLQKKNLNENSKPAYYTIVW